MDTSSLVAALAPAFAAGFALQRLLEILDPILEKLASGKDRKSTRLNSSHSQISYAVFCLKKKHQHETRFIAAFTVTLRAPAALPPMHHVPLHTRDAHPCFQITPTFPLAPLHSSSLTISHY